MLLTGWHCPGGRVGEGRVSAGSAASPCRQAGVGAQAKHPAKGLPGRPFVRLPAPALPAWRDCVTDAVLTAESLT
jgi:hypothetical protein